MHFSCSRVHPFRTPHLSFTQKNSSEIYNIHNTNSESESANRGASDNESQNGPAPGDDGPDLEFLLEIGGEIRRASRYVWNNTGSNWIHAKGVLQGENPELRPDQDESDSTYKEDPSYTPVYRVRDLVKC